MIGGIPLRDLNMYQVTSIKLDLKEAMKYDMDKETLGKQFNLILNRHQITYWDIYKSLDLIV